MGVEAYITGSEWPPVGTCHCTGCVTLRGFVTIEESTASGDFGSPPPLQKISDICFRVGGGKGYSYRATCDDNSPALTP